MKPALLLLFFLAAGCAPVNYQETSDAARRRQIAGRWYDQYLQGFSYAQGESMYHPNGTFTATYETVAPGTTAAEPAHRETVTWSGKWRVENGELIEDITTSSDFLKTPMDRPMVRLISKVTSQRLALRNTTGNVNEYARKRPAPPKVSFTPGNL